MGGQCLEGRTREGWSCGVMIFQWRTSSSHRHVIKQEDSAPLLRLIMPYMYDLFRLQTPRSYRPSIWRDCQCDHSALVGIQYLRDSTRGQLPQYHFTILRAAHHPSVRFDLVRGQGRVEKSGTRKLFRHKLSWRFERLEDFGGVDVVYPQGGRQGRREDVGGGGGKGGVRAALSEGLNRDLHWGVRIIV